MLRRLRGWWRSWQLKRRQKLLSRRLEEVEAKARELLREKHDEFTASPITFAERVLGLKPFPYQAKCLRWLREHHAALSADDRDEVDSILIDEARTPLIISGPAEESTELYVRLDRVVPRLKSGQDYTIDEKSRTVALTDEGVARVEKLIRVTNLYDPKNIENSV